MTATLARRDGFSKTSSGAEIAIFIPNVTARQDGPTTSTKATV